MHMCVTCAYPDVMPKMIQVRNVPDEFHRELVRRARARGQTLTDYIQALLEREVARPLAQEVFRRVEGREPVELPLPAAQLIREEPWRRGWALPWSPRIDVSPERPRG